MNRRLLILLVVISVGFIANISDVEAFNIEKGSISIGGASTFELGTHDTDRTHSFDRFSLSLNSGYFIIDNFEIGVFLRLSYYDSSSSESKFYSISPFVSYHYPLNDFSNLFFTGSIGYSKSDMDSDYVLSDDSDGIALSAQIGWEYFFNNSVSGTIGLSYDRIEMDYDNDTNYGFDDETATSITSIIGLRVYF